MTLQQKRRVYITVIVFTLAFIWGQSCLSRTQSSAESEIVKGWLEVIFSKDTPLSRFILTYVRKIAHFTEFGVLGLELCAFTYICTENAYKNKIRAAFFGPVAAIIDETIQIFTGRGSSFFDVLIDSSGYFTFSLIFIATVLLIKGIKKGKIKNV